MTNFWCWFSDSVSYNFLYLFSSHLNHYSVEDDLLLEVLDKNITWIWVKHLVSCRIMFHFLFQKCVLVSFRRVVLIMKIMGLFSNMLQLNMNEKVDSHFKYQHPTYWIQFLLKDHMCMASGSHGPPKVSPGPAMPDLSMPCRWATPETAMGWATCSMGDLQPSSFPWDTPRRMPMSKTHSIQYQ